MLGRKKIDGEEVIVKVDSPLKKFFKRELREIQSFELNEDSFRMAGDWPISIKIIASTCLAIALLVAANQFHFKSMQSNYDKMVKEETTLKESVKFKILQTAGIDLYKERIENMSKDFESQLSQLPTAMEIDGVLRDITEKGDSNRIEFKKFQMMKELTSEFYIEHPISMELTGTYHDLASFLNDVSSSDRIVTFHNFDLTKSEKEDDNKTLNLKVIAKTYKYRNKANETEGEN